MKETDPITSNSSASVKTEKHSVNIESFSEAVRRILLLRKFSVQNIIETEYRILTEPVMSHKIHIHQHMTLYLFYSLLKLLQLL